MLPFPFVAAIRPSGISAAIAIPSTPTNFWLYGLTPASIGLTFTLYLGFQLRIHPIWKAKSISRSDKPRLSFKLVVWFWFSCNLAVIFLYSLFRSEMVSRFLAESFCLGTCFILRAIRCWLAHSWELSGLKVAVWPLAGFTQTYPLIFSPLTASAKPWQKIVSSAKIRQFDFVSSHIGQGLWRLVGTGRLLNIVPSFT